MSRRAPVSQKVLPIKAQDERTKEEARKAKDAADAAAVLAKEQDRKDMDPIGEPLEYGSFVYDQNPAQCFGQAVIDAVKGDVSKIPNWRFKRRYLARKIIIDTFTTEAAYEAAQVEKRRAMCKQFGFKYAALGPNHSVMPHTDKKLREKFPSQVEQLGLV